MVIALCYGHKIYKFESCTRLLCNAITMYIPLLVFIINKSIYIYIYFYFLALKQYKIN